MNLRFALSVILLFSAAAGTHAGTPFQGPQGSDTSSRRVAREVAHELAMLPWYGIFDWVEASVSPDGRVTLKGWVTRESTREDAVAGMKDVEGVSSVTNEIEVLPLSPADNRLRRSLYLALFEYDSPLFRYATGANPSIHIIVNNGRVILKGMVASRVDRDTAGARANSISGIFEVRNDLTIDPAGAGN